MNVSIVDVDLWLGEKLTFNWFRLAFLFFRLLDFWLLNFCLDFALCVNFIKYLTFYDFRLSFVLSFYNYRLRFMLWLNLYLNFRLDFLSFFIPLNFIFNWNLLYFILLPNPLNIIIYINFPNFRSPNRFNIFLLILLLFFNFFPNILALFNMLNLFLFNRSLSWSRCRFWFLLNNIKWFGLSRFSFQFQRFIHRSSCNCLNLFKIIDFFSLIS